MMELDCPEWVWEGQNFLVTVTADNEPVNNALVLFVLDNYYDFTHTNSEGQGVLTAPEVDNESNGTIIVNKTGYGSPDEQFIAVKRMIPGDANGDGRVLGSDVTYLVGYFRGVNPPPNPYLAGDANGDCLVLGSDVTYLVNYFRGTGPAPVRGDC